MQPDASHVNPTRASVQAVPQYPAFESIKVFTLTPSSTLLQNSRDLHGQVSSFSVEMQNAVEAALAGEVSPERAAQLGIASLMAINELGVNAVLYGLLGMEGALRDKFNKATALLRYSDTTDLPESAGAISAASELIVALSGDPGAAPVFTSVSQATCTVNQALEQFFTSTGRMNKAAVITVEISETPSGSNSLAESGEPVTTVDHSKMRRSLQITFYEPSDFDLFRKWILSNDFDGSDFAQCNGRGVALTRAYFPTEDGCYVTDLGRKGVLKIICPLVPVQPALATQSAA